MDRILQAYRKRIYGFLTQYVKVKSEVEDLTQDVMIKLWVNRNNLQHVKDLEKYILTVAYNVVMDHFKKMQKSKSYREKVWQQIQENENTVLKTVLKNDLLDHVDKVIDMLPQRQQTVYRMNKVEGKSLEEIGKKLDISPYTVKNHLAQALKSLKHRINPDYFLLFIIFLEV